MSWSQRQRAEFLARSEKLNRKESLLYYVIVGLTPDTAELSFEKILKRDPIHDATLLVTRSQEVQGDIQNGTATCETTMHVCKYLDEEVDAGEHRSMRRCRCIRVGQSCQETGF